MKIYVTHSTAFDFKNELYIPIRNSELNKKYEFTLPHEQSGAQFNSKEFLKECDLVIAEVSYPSTGQGIELGWASSNGVPVACIYKKGTKPSGALNAVSDNFLEYESTEDIMLKIGEGINKVNVS